MRAFLKIRHSFTKNMPAPSIGKLVIIGTLRKISWGGEPEAARRTTHDFTLGQRLAHLTSIVEPMKQRIRDGVPPSRKVFNNSALIDRQRP